MPDQEKCTRTSAPPADPPEPEEPDDPGDTLFRHTFLWRLRNSDDREALIRLENGRISAMYEAGCWGHDPMIPGMAGALAADVEALAAYALGIARCCEESRMERADLPICCAAPKWAEKLAVLAVEMRTAASVARGSA